MSRTHKLSPTNERRLKAMKKVMRETCHQVKPMVSTDRKKESNRRACRQFRVTAWD